ncbi:MAG: hypothetical protein IJP70_01765 [Bacteroidales bacterium]|nr:hypothetical protein [Bacteroidales bacterium]
MHQNKHICKLAICVIAWLFTGNLRAGEGELQQTYETQISLSNSKTPLWLNANKYGLSSLNHDNGYFRGTLEYNHNTQSKRWSYGAGVDLVVPVGYKSKGYKDSYTSHIIIQQLYADIRYRNFVLSAGSRQLPLFLKYQGLSSGSQTLGINARPIPQVRLGLDHWWNIPGLHKWVSVMAHGSYGVLTDGEWEESFAKGSGYKYNKWTRYHEKAGYIRFGNTDRFPLTGIFGLEKAAEFGGYLYHWGGTDQNGYTAHEKLRLKSNLRSYWNALVPGGSDTSDKTFHNAEGNQLGSWIVRFDWTTPRYVIGLYADHFFEDHSSMFFLDYDGYGNGADYDTKKDFKFLLYELQDLMIGIDVKFSHCKFVNGAVIEFINTKYQSGPVYHDHNIGNSDHIGGIDDYYNHSRLSGWQHWGQAIGNPLYRSPLYNSNGYIGCSDNRFCAWHFGLEGNFLSPLSYRVLYTWQQGVGTYRMPFIHKNENTSILAELKFRMPESSSLHHFNFLCSYGADFGRLLGNNSGIQLTVQYKL